MMIKDGKIQKPNKKSLKAKGKNKVNGKGKDKKVYIPKPKNPKPIAKERPAKDDVCHHYKEVGHWKRNCPVYLAELLNKKKQVSDASYSDITVGLILNGLTKDFAGFVSNYKMHNMGKTIGEIHAMLMEYEKGLPKKAKTPQVMMIKKGKIQKANKKSLKVKGKVIGKGKDKKVYVRKPTNPKPIAKERPAKDDACHHCKEGFRIEKKLKRGALYLYGAWSLVKRNLDSTYLWHCRLAHINKKRIKQLQQDGLLKSTDDESFDQCESCLSGKMTKKPFPHSNERAKDLLGIIHTDVCGLLRHVSRQGASYFITFTDDYSRYGYVYLLKHKHEVFETFKVFKNEVENQLGKTIKAIRSDRGGEYISQEFKDYLKANGIVPYRPTFLHTPTQMEYS
ncbi:retrotransposon protein, putative, ty1-copia subclass [Tanacetum coccineum]